MKSFIFMSLLLGSISSYADKFEEGNLPFNFNQLTGTSMVVQFKFLPTTGKQMDDRYGWSETYWPSNLGGIAYRWNHPNPEPFRFRFFSKSELMKFNETQLSQLSPAELYDIAMGDYNYTLTRKALSLYNSRDLWWEGICHGWSLAASNFPEPDKVSVQNPDGINVPFGSSDVKGLLAMHEAYNYGGRFAFTGRRCKVSGKVPGEGNSRDTNTNPPSEAEANLPECKDINAGAFHLILSNMIGIHGKGFIADVDRFNDVWNQPVTSFESMIDGEESVSKLEYEAGVARKIRMKTKMTYGEELKFYSPEIAATGAINFVSKEPVTGTPHQEFRSKNYEYLIELNADGVIIGGSWISDTRPDFIWLYERPKTFKNSPITLGGLAKIYKPVQR